MAILVTGGTKGIGRAIALSFAETGNHVFLNYASDDAAAGEAKAAIEAKGAIDLASGSFLDFARVLGQPHHGTDNGQIGRAHV